MQKPQKFAVRQPAAMLLQFADCSLTFLIEDVFRDIAVSHVKHPLRQMIDELPRPSHGFLRDQRVIDIAADAVQHGELAHLFMSARPQCLGGSLVLCFIEVVTPVAFELYFPERGGCFGRFRNDQRLWILVCQIAVHIEIREVGCRADQRVRRRDRLGIAGFATFARSRPRLRC